MSPVPIFVSAGAAPLASRGGGIVRRFGQGPKPYFRDRARIAGAKGALAKSPRCTYPPAAMTMELTLGLLAASAALLGYSVWRVQRPGDRDLSRPRLILDWHYVMFPAILSTGLLALHAVKLAMGR